MGAKLGFVAARARTVVAAASGASTGRAYVSFLSDAGAGRTAYGERTYARLATLMQAHDSTNVFRLNRNVEPAAGSGTRDQGAPLRGVSDRRRRRRQEGAGAA
jgi:hypothetical protein